MDFTAIISSRSSARRSGPPGETEVLALNPQRRVKILNATGWSELFKGTLNLEVNEQVVQRLTSRSPTIRELGSEVNYPEKYQNIPIKRKAYLYFKAIICFGDKSEDVLIRTAENPLKNRIEAFAPVKLRDSLGLADGDQVLCRIND